MGRLKRVLDPDQAGALVEAPRCKCGQPVKGNYTDHDGNPQCEDCWVAVLSHTRKSDYENTSPGFNPLEEPIVQLGIGTIALNALERLGKLKIKDLLAMTAEEILAVSWVSKADVAKIEDKLEGMGLYLKKPAAG